MGSPSSEGAATNEAETPSPVADETQSFPFFTRLPSEIRRHIWFMTFSPRVIQIMIHPDTGRGTRSELVGFFFTATEDLVAIRPSYIAMEMTGSTFHPSPAWSRPYPPGPVALRVCRESREVALKHYERAFGPVNLKIGEEAKFSESAVGSGEKKIWVDFKRDLIAVLYHDNRSPTYLSMKPNHPLYLVTVYAKGEMKKIRRLAVSECWYPASHPARQVHHSHNHIFNGRHGPAPDHPTAGPGYFDQATSFHRESAVNYLRKFLKEFKNIEELEVYEIGGRPIPVHINGLQTVENDFLVVDMAVWREKLLEAFKIEKENNPEWTANLPLITVRKGLHGVDDRWDGTFLT
jgi:hypothetical protein